MKLRLAILATLGVALAFYLFLYIGWRAVFSSAIAIGWGNFAILCLYALGLFLLLGTAWRVLLPEASGFGPWVFVRARMVRDSAAAILPFSELGGIALGVRAAVLLGVPSPLATASMIVDVTTELLAQIAYLALGLAILTVRAPQNSSVAWLTTSSLIGLVLAAIGAAMFIVVQRYGRRITARLATPLLRDAGRTTNGVIAALDAIYRSPGRVTLSVALHFGAWIASGVATWIAFRMMGAHIDFAAVIAIESLICALRSAAVLIPNGLGVQEAGYAFLTPLFGVSAQLGLAVSVLKRARDIAVGVPILLLWQAAEGRYALARTAEPKSNQASL